MLKQQVASLLSGTTTLIPLFTFSDVLPHLAGLSHAFQQKDVSFTVVKPLVTGTQAAINAFLVTPGEHFQSLSAVFSELEDYGINSLRLIQWRPSRKMFIANICVRFQRYQDIKL